MNEEEFVNFYTEREKIKPLSMQELVKGLKNINSKTSTDQNGISNRILKHASQTTKDLMLCLFNKCLEHKKVPAYWKHYFYEPKGTRIIYRKEKDPCYLF